jgi:hypothetical protein
LVRQWCRIPFVFFHVAAWVREVHRQHLFERALRTELSPCVLVHGLLVLVCAAMARENVNSPKFLQRIMGCHVVIWARFLR